MQVQCEIKSSAVGGTTCMSEAQLKWQILIRGSQKSISRSCVWKHPRVLCAFRDSESWGGLVMRNFEIANEACLYVLLLLLFVFEYGYNIKQWRVEIYTWTWKTVPSAFFANFVPYCSWCLVTADKYLICWNVKTTGITIYTDLTMRLFSSGLWHHVVLWVVTDVGVSRFLHNVNNHTKDYTASHSGIQKFRAWIVTERFETFQASLVL